MDKLPKKGGVLLHPDHFEHIITDQPDVGWFEFRPEDFLAMGGERHYYLEKIAAQYPIAMHGKALSLGSAESTNEKHLQNVKALVERYSPVNISEPLAWSRWQGAYFAESLPLPYNLESLDQATFNIRKVQNTLGRRILVSNAAQYLPFTTNVMSEGVFFEELVRNTGCGLLLDLTALYATSMNNDLDPFRELQQYPLAAIKEIHVSGHSLLRLNDDHVSVVADNSSAVSKPTWQLYREALSLLPRPVATLVKWCGTQPDFSVLLAEVDKVHSIMDEIETLGSSGVVL